MQLYLIMLIIMTLQGQMRMHTLCDVVAEAHTAHGDLKRIGLLHNAQIFSVYYVNFPCRL